jgi:hypothetical protein
MTPYVTVTLAAAKLVAGFRGNFKRKEPPVSDDHEDGDRIDAFKEIWDRRPRMTYENLSLVFNEAGALVIEQRDGSEVASQATIPEWQLDLVLAFIKQHRLSPMHAGFAAAASARRDTQ